MTTVTIEMTLLEEVCEWMWANPPATGWGGLDHRADMERLELLSKLRAQLEPPTAPALRGAVLGCNRHEDCSQAPKGQLCCFDPHCNQPDCRRPQ